MAMSQTMSSPSDWSQLYQQNLNNSDQTTMFGDRLADATVVTTTAANALNPLGSGGNATSSSAAGAGSGHLSPEGRVSKPVRRRSRASRRTPTTLLNTDTSNFRAMVQQFTGGPSAPFGASGPQIHAPVFSFGLGSGRSQAGHHHVNPSGIMLPTGYHHLQFQQQPQQQYNQQQQQGQFSPYMFSLGNNGSGGGGAAPVGGDHVFLQRLGNPSRPTSTSSQSELVSSEGFVMGGGVVSSSSPPSQLLPPPLGSRGAPPPPQSASNENRSNTFLF